MVKRQTMTSEDSAELTNGYNDALSAYKDTIKEVTISDLLQAFNGSKSDLQRSLAGIPLGGKLPAKGTPDRTHYESQGKNISRWLKFESGTGTKANSRGFSGADTQGKFKDLFVKRGQGVPPGMSISMTGWIGYDGDFRYRTVDINSSQYPIDMQAFMSAMSKGDTHAAYREVFSSYAKALSVAQADSVTIEFDESEE